MLRLRQVCLVAPDLEPAVEAVRSVFGVDVCHRDPAVAAYGLENALFVFGHQFLEIVAPVGGHVAGSGATAAGRFLDRSGGRGGYMAIFDTDDPERRRAHVLSLGVRIAHTMDRPGFRGIQLHPRDGRATMLEFDRSDGNERLDGAYWPAGPHWQEGQQLDRVAGIPWVEVRSPDRDGLAAHWARLIDVPLAHGDDGSPELRFDLGAVRFTAGAPGSAELLHTLHVDVGDARAVLAAARAAGCTDDDIDAGTGAPGFVLCGVRFVPRTVAAR